MFWSEVGPVTQNDRHHSYWWATAARNQGAVLKWCHKAIVLAQSTSNVARVLLMDTRLVMAEIEQHTRVRRVPLSCTWASTFTLISHPWQSWLQLSPPRIRIAPTERIHTKTIWLLLRQKIRQNGVPIDHCSIQSAQREHHVLESSSSVYYPNTSPTPMCDRQCNRPFVSD